MGFWFHLSLQHLKHLTCLLLAVMLLHAARPQDCSILLSIGHTPSECKGLMLIVPSFR